jgi:hypothetical protein
MDLFTPFTKSKLPRKLVNKASKPIFDDLPNWRPKGTPRHHIFQQFFTPAERRRLKAIPENDVTSEIQLLRVLLARCFAMVPRYPNDSKIPALPIDLHIKFVNTFRQVAVVIGSMVTLQRKSHKGDGDDFILQALREMNPYEDLE